MFCDQNLSNYDLHFCTFINSSFPFKCSSIFEMLISLNNFVSY